MAHAILRCVSCFSLSLVSGSPEPTMQGKSKSGSHFLFVCLFVKPTNNATELRRIKRNRIMCKEITKCPKCGKENGDILNERTIGMRKYILFVISVLFSFLSCQQNLIVEEEPKEIHIAFSVKNGYNNVETNSISLSGEGESMQVNLSCNDSWIVKSNASSWLSVSPETGTDDAILTIKAQKNTQTSSRKGSIVVVTSSNKRETLEVTQSGKKVEMSVSPTSISFPPYSSYSYEPVKLALKTNESWKAISSDASWLTFKASKKELSGKGDTEILVYCIGKNNTSKVREGIITISSGDYSVQVKVSQENPSLVVEKDEINVNCAEQKLWVKEEIKVSNFFYYNASTDVEWLNIEGGSKIEGGGSKEENLSYLLSLLIDENFETSSRQAVVKVWLELDDGKLERSIKIIQSGSPCGEENGHKWVDLGLPSGTLWATMNVGATSLEDAGGYYAWGETVTKSCYDWSTYKWCNGSYDKLIKYNYKEEYAYDIPWYGKLCDGKHVLELSDDAAYMNWGGKWRMPTPEEWKELSEYCSWNGKVIFIEKPDVDVYGIKFVGPKGNSIFLPAAGYYYDSERKFWQDGYWWGYYWSSYLLDWPSPDGAQPSKAYHCNFQNYGFSENRGMSRFYGLNVRPVCHP